MTRAALLRVPLRAFAVIFGAFFVVQGFVTGGFLAIVSLFGGPAEHIASVLGFIVFSVGLMAVGAWLLYAGFCDFPYLTAVVRNRRSTS